MPAAPSSADVPHRCLFYKQPSPAIANAILSGNRGPSVDEATLARAVPISHIRDAL